jgi:hypothetical protein
MSLNETGQIAHGEFVSAFQMEMESITSTKRNKKEVNFGHITQKTIHGKMHIDDRGASFIAQID